MRRNIFVGNLAWATDDETLMEHFQQAGEVTRAKVMTDIQTGRSRGFAFVTMGTEEQHEEAIRLLHDSSLDGRSIVVAEAKEKPEREKPRYNNRDDRGDSRDNRDNRDNNRDNRDNRDNRGDTRNNDRRRY